MTATTAMMTSPTAVDFAANLRLLADVAIAEYKVEKAALDVAVIASPRHSAATSAAKSRLVSEKIRGNIKNRDFIRMAAAAMPWIPLARSKRKRVIMSPEPIVKEESKKMIKKRINHRDSQWKGGVPADMPEEFKNRIRQLAGPEDVVSGEKLLIQKALTARDVEENQSRLSIPVRRMAEREFLREAEEWVLRQRVGDRVGSIDGVTLVDPSLKRCRVSLRRWVMRKGKGRKNSVSYVVPKKWKEIFERLGLKEGMTVQVWSFRVNEELWLALIRL